MFIGVMTMYAGGYFFRGHSVYLSKYKQLTVFCQFLISVRLSVVDYRSRHCW